MIPRYMEKHYKLRLGILFIIDDMRLIINGYNKLFESVNDM